jgi:uncharacterized membrane protein (DUF485 family)
VVVGQHRRPTTLVTGSCSIATLADIAIALAAFAAAALIAAALGAVNAGTALGVGQVVFVFVVTGLLLFRD